MQVFQKSQGISLISHFKQDVLADFDRLFEEVFRIYSTELGFKTAYLFMHEQDRNCLKLARGKSTASSLVNLTEIECPIHRPSLLVQAFENKEIIKTESYEDLLGIKIKLNTESANSPMLILPVYVFNEGIGVFVLIAEDVNDFSEQEISFLSNFSQQIGLHIFTAWNLDQSIIQTRGLMRSKNEYEELIKIKKEYFEEMQKLLVKLLQEPSLNDETQMKLAESLMYLNSVMLLSDSTVEKHTQTP